MSVFLDGAYLLCNSIHTKYFIIKIIIIIMKIITNPSPRETTPVD